MPGKGEPEDHFVALDNQPKYRIKNGELMIHLQAPDLGSLNSGSLVYFCLLYTSMGNDRFRFITAHVLQQPGTDSDQRGVATRTGSEGVDVRRCV